MGKAKHKRSLALLLCAALLSAQLGGAAYAKETKEGTGGLCEHHPEHTAACGFVEAVEGHGCNHIHDEECYERVFDCPHEHDDGCYEEDNTASDSNASTPNCPHVHDEDCYTDRLQCPHVHDDACGYVNAVEGHACSYVCDECKEEPTAVCITGFDPLDEEIQNRRVPAGTKWDDLALPDTLAARGYRVSDGEDSKEETMTVEDVVWEIDPDHLANDGNSIYNPGIGSYCLTPILPSEYEVETNVDLPEIYVMIDGQVNTLNSFPEKYNKDDVMVINGMIAQYDLSAEPDDPERWGFVKWTYHENPGEKRVRQLDLNKKELSGTLDVSGLEALETLYCANNSLEGLDVSGLKKLTTLHCNNNNLKELDVSNLDNLSDLKCHNNELAELNVSPRGSLRTLQCSGNNLTTLEVSGLRNLETLYCSDNQNLAQMDLSGLERLATVECSNTSLTELNMDPDRLRKLTTLRCANTNLAELADLNEMTGLVVLDCSGNNLTELSLSGLTKLDWLTCADNNMEKLTLDNLPKLRILECFSNKLKDLDVSGVPGLTKLICYSNDLEMLDLSSLMKLSNLDCSDNSLNKLDLNNVVKLETFNCSSNNLEKIDGLETLERVVILDCSQNQLQELDISKLTDLMGLDCSKNQLTALDVSNMKYLQQLFLSANPLSSLKLSERDELTVGSTAGGTVILTDYAHDSKSVTLTATENDGYIFQKWMANGTSLADDTLNPAEFNLTGNIDITPIYGNQSLLAAKRAIEGATYTVSQADARTKDELKAALVRQINALDGMEATGVTVSADQITLDSFIAAVAGNVDIPSGINGSFSFTVTLAKGTASDMTGSKTGTITASVYISSDTALSNLSVTGADITPAFDPAITSYTASVNHDTASVTISATAADHRSTVSGDLGVKNLSDGSNIFTVTVTAEDGSIKNYVVTIDRAKETPGGQTGGGDGNDGSSESDDGSSGSGSGGNSSGSVTVQLSTSIQTGSLATGVIYPGNPAKDGNVEISSGQVADAISKATDAVNRAANAQTNGGGKSGVSVAVRLSEDTESITLSREALDQLIASEVRGFRLDFAGASMNFDLAALKEMAVQTDGSLVFSVKKVSELTGEALEVIGKRPAYQFTVTGQKNGNPVTVMNFGEGRVTLEFVYTPAAGELAGGLGLVRVEQDGGVTWFEQSGYNADVKCLIGLTSHLSIYGVGYKAPTEDSN